MRPIYVKLTQLLYLLLLPVPHDRARAEARPAHNIWILDGSGSMYGEMRAALRDLRGKVRELRPGDYLSFAFFSSRGDWSFPIKAFQYTGQNADVLERMFDELRPPYNLTNFSEVLRETVQVIDALGFLNATHILWFFSDGMANDPSVSSEHAATERILRDHLASRLTAAMTVSYGDYADKLFLARMAQLMGGEMIPAAYLRDVSAPLSRFIKTARSYEPRVPVDVPAGAQAAYTLGAGGSITLYEVENGVCSVAPAEGVDVLYVITDRKPQTAMPAAYTPLHTGGHRGLNLQDEQLQAGMLAAAVVLSQREQRDQAVEVLGRTGDVHLVKLMANAFTPTEAGGAERAVAAATTDPSSRYIDGYRENAVPPRDAFNLLAALTLLQSDPEAILHPRHPSFSYKRIGRASEVRPGFPSFVPVPDASSPMTDFVWHKELLNLGLRVRLAGSVELPDAVRDPDGPGNAVIYRPDTLAPVFETFEWKTYNIVEGGFLHTTVLPVSLSRYSFEQLQREGLIAGGFAWQPQTIYTVQTEAVPIINREMADGERSASAMCRHILEAKRLEAEAKVYKHLRDELDPKRETVQRTPWSVAEQRFLLAAGFREDGSFNPPRTEAEKTDYRDVPRFKITPKGLSSLPAVDEVRARTTALGGYAQAVQAGAGRGKALTISQRMVAEALYRYGTAFSLNPFLAAEDPAKISKQEAVTRLAWLDLHIKTTKAALAAERGAVQRPKFVITLTQTWFIEPEMTPRKPEGNKLTVDGQEFTIIVDTERVYI